MIFNPSQIRGSLTALSDFARKRSLSDVEAETSRLRTLTRSSFRGGVSRFTASPVGRIASIAPGPIGSAVRTLAPLGQPIAMPSAIPGPTSALSASQSSNNPTLAQVGDLPWWARAGISILGGAIGRGNGNGAGAPLATGCPEGHVYRNGRCEETGIRGSIERILPGGQTGTLTDAYGNAVVGAFGIPALVPAQVGQTLRGPILRCPPGAVLGKDSLCYMKGSIPRQFRKWRPKPKPPITAGDAKAIRRADRTKARVKRLAGDVGFTCRPKGRR